jgi:hypothetical protein
MSARVVAVANHINYVRVNNPKKETCTDNVQVNSNNICSLMEVITAGGWLALKIRMTDGSEWVSPIAEFHEAYAPNSAHVFAQTNVLVRLRGIAQSSASMVLGVSTTPCSSEKR